MTQLSQLETIDFKNDEQVSKVLKPQPLKLEETVSKTIEKTTYILKKPQERFASVDQRKKFQGTMAKQGVVPQINILPRYMQANKAFLLKDRSRD